MCSSDLSVLGDGAIPHIYRLAQEAPDKEIAHQADATLARHWTQDPGDFRGWNYANQVATEYLVAREQES